MKALVFHRPKKVSVDNIPDPVIEKSTDIILKVTSTAICGSDLNIYNGFVLQGRPMILGHEFMGTVEEVGSEIRHLKYRDRVVIPSGIACGQCFFCEHQLSSQCENSNPNYGPEGGLLREKSAGIFGYTDLYGGHNGGQAQYVRVPFANFGPRKIPHTLSDEEVLFTTDTFPTGYAAIDWADMKGGETVAVFGCGSVGVMAIKSAWLKGASRVIGIDKLDYRLNIAKKSAKAEVINFKETDPIEAIREMTKGRGVDICVDAVGMGADRNMFEKVSNLAHLQAGTISALKLCASAVRRGGTITAVGAYATTYDDFPLGQLFDKGVKLKMGQVPVHHYIDELLGFIKDKKVVLSDIISHRLPLERAPEAYHIFNNKEDKCMKVILKPHG